MGGEHTDSVKTATNRIVAAIIADKEDYDGTGNVFETDHAITDTASLYITVACNVPNIIPERFEITDIKYMMNPTNAVTYQLYLCEGSSADDTTQASYKVFDSSASQADSTEYVYHEGYTGSYPGITTADGTLPVIVNLQTPGRLYYMIDWSGAPGDTPGYIKVRGKLLK